MKSCLTVFVMTALFLVVWAALDWFATVTSPVLGPLVLWGVVVWLIVLMVRAYKDAGK